MNAYLRLFLCFVNCDMYIYLYISLYLATFAYVNICLYIIAFPVNNIVLFTFCRLFCCVASVMAIVSTCLTGAEATTG